MILQNTNHIDIIEDGEELESTKMEMDADSFVFLMQMVSKFYADSVGSPIRECFSNGWDSHQKAGVDKPIIVKLYKDKTNNWNFSVRDSGLGIDKELVENVIKKYGKSTKRGDAKALGAFGLGFKSPLAYTSAFYFVGWKDGMERKWMMRESEEGNSVDLIYEKTSEEGNGAEVIIPVQSWDVRDWSNKIREQLCYFPNSYIIDEFKPFDNNYKIFETEDFKWSEMCETREMHLCLGDVYYPLDWGKLGISRIDVPVGLKFSLTDGIEPLPARESFKYNNQSKAIILEKIKKVATWFIERYNTTVQEFETFMEAYDHIGVSTYYLEIEGKKFVLNDLLSHTSIVVQETKVKGIELKSPRFYKAQRVDLIEEYNVVAFWDGNYWKRKHLSYELNENLFTRSAYRVKGPIVVVNQTITGNIKTYLLEKYNKKNVVYAEKVKERKLNGSSWFGGYRSLLSLTEDNRGQWRDYIKEWQLVRKSITDTFIMELDIDQSQEYLDWLEKRRADLKANRVAGVYKGKTLGKMEGDITIAYSRLSALDSKSVVFEKKAYPIKDLYKNKFLTLYWEDTAENKSKALQYHHLTTLFKLKIALIGKRELTKLPKLHNFMQEQDYNKTAQFRKFVTAIKAKEVISIYESMNISGKNIAQEVLTKHCKDIERLETYVQANYSAYGPSAALRADMVRIADEHNYYDLTEMVVINRVRKDLDKYDFLPLLKQPSQWDEPAKKAYNRLINQMVLFKKLYHKQFPEFEIVVAPPVEVFEAMYPEYNVDGVKGTIAEEELMKMEK